MSKVFVIGAAGGVGRRLVRLLVKQGDSVLALHHRPEQAAQLSEAGAQPVAGSLTEMTAAQLAERMKGAEAVVFSAGAGGKGGPELTNAVDGDGLEKAVEAAKLAGISRFLLVSVFPEAWRDKPRNENFENYMRVKKLADVALAESGLDWVILRPGTLTDSEETEVRLGLALPYGDVSREAVAATLAALIAQPKVSRQILEVTEGKLTPQQAVQQVLAG